VEAGMGKWVEQSLSNVSMYQKAGGTSSVSRLDFYNGEIPLVIIGAIIEDGKSMITLFYVEELTGVIKILTAILKNPSS